MIRKQRQNGFSLTEVLLATGVLAVGFAMIAMVFPVGIHLTRLATERTLSPAITEEALSIIRLYELDPAKLPTAPPIFSNLFSAEYLTDQSLRYFYYSLIDNTFDPEDPVNFPLPTQGTAFYQTLIEEVNTQLAEDSGYPSLPAEFFAQNPEQRQRYGWDILCRRTAANQADLWIFVYRRVEGARYYGFTYDYVNRTFPAAPQVFVDRPMPIPASITPIPIVNFLTDPFIIEIDGPATATEGPVYPLATSHRFFTEGAWVISDADGQMYQITRREDLDGDNIFETLILDRAWQTMRVPHVIWVLPPAVGTGRNLCIDVLAAPY